MVSVSSPGLISVREFILAEPLTPKAAEEYKEKVEIPCGI